MNDKMRNHLPQIDLEKMAAILDIETRFITGRITLQEGRDEIAQRVGKIRAYHLAFIEQTMTEHTDDECIRENMAQKLRLFEGFMDTSRPELPTDHPIAHYYRENDELRRLLLAVEDLVQYPVIKNQWLELLEPIGQYPTHYKRKQNQLYPLLEQKGFDRPTTTMWTFDDMVRNLIRECQALLDAGTDEESFVKKCQELVYYARDLMEKEETILYPTSLAMITAEEFEHMKGGDAEIGFAFFTVEAPTAAPSPSTTSAATPTTMEGFGAELQELLAKYGYSAGSQQANQVLDVATGQMTLEQINLVYRHMPVDITYVDENEIVKFYTDTAHRVFPRSRNVIGREVMNCHPRKSAHVVREVIDTLKSGKEDRAEFWINKPGLFIYIVYVAVRDAEGRFRGVLEMMQDCTHIRSLEGSQTLLKWASEAGVPTELSTPSNSDKSEVTPEVNTVSTVTLDATSTMPPTEPSTEHNSSTPTSIQPEDITPSTRLQDLLDRFPELRQRLTEISPLFAMLRTPFGKLMAKKADIQAMSDRSGVELHRLLNELRRIIGEMKAK